MGLSEFRQNLVSGEWVLFSTARSQRPHRRESDQHEPQPKADCVFENLDASQEVVWKDAAEWSVAVIKNKFPAVHAGVDASGTQFGPFNIKAATGEHNVFVLRDHDKQLHTLSVDEMIPVVQAYKRRENEIIQESPGIKYVLIFHNFGASAGASIHHPHSQILSTPILPPTVARSLEGARKFYQEHGKRAYDVMTAWEQEQGKRIIYENESFIAYCPFVSHHPGEIRISPKEGQSHFNEMPDTLNRPFADALSMTLRKMAKALNEPSYNFYIHSGPAGQSMEGVHDFYTWHLEVIPKLNVDAGFELGTGIEVNSVDPDEFAELLRSTHV